jgi:Tol biopolymer transport system component
MTIALLIALAVLQAPAPHADALTFGTPQKVISLDKIKGEPTQLSWSPDGTQVYVQAAERTRIGTFQNPHHYVVTLADGKMKGVDAPPAWATDYQTWKSNKWAPGVHTFAIDISEANRTNKATNAPMGGALAKGGESGAGMGNMDEAVNAALNSQTQHVITLKLKGEIVGEYVDTQFLPGYTFGWAPPVFGTAITYTNTQGHLAVMDEQGGKKDVAESQHVLLPAWSENGKQIAYVQKDGKKFDLLMVDVK